MHRVHHSVARPETDSNYGSCLSLWDRLFGTYVAQPRAGHDRMSIGLESFRTPADQSLWALLMQPFRRELPTRRLLRARRRNRRSTTRPQRNGGPPIQATSAERVPRVTGVTRCSS